MENVKAIVLAAGKGTRLRDENIDLPKVLREANGRPLLSYVLDALDFLPREDILLVLGFQAEKVRARFPDYPWVLQETQDGTGHAVKCAMEKLRDFDGTVMVCCGDMPLIRRESYMELLDMHLREGNACTFLTGSSTLDLACGRVLRKADGSFSEVVEDKDCTPAQKAVTELNTGVYAFRADALRQGLGQLTRHNAQKEYYLTDVPTHIAKDGGRIGLCYRKLDEQIIGVNTKEHLEMVEKFLRGES